MLQALGGLGRKLYRAFEAAERKAMDADALALADGLRLGNRVVGRGGKLEAPAAIARRLQAAADRLDLSARADLAARVADAKAGQGVALARTPQALESRAADALKRLAALEHDSAATVGVHTSADARNLGHSWISFQRKGQELHTYGTWGNQPNGPAVGNGLFQDLELAFKPDASRVIKVDAAAVARLEQLARQYADAKDAAWSSTNPCSGFARDAWEAVTGESLRSRTFTTPQALRRIIERLNSKQPIPS
jgi:hypothetical protein